jgi:hypothetical protein
MTQTHRTWLKYGGNALMLLWLALGVSVILYYNLVHPDHRPLIRDHSIFDVRQVSMQARVVRPHLVGKANRVAAKTGTWGVFILGRNRLGLVPGGTARPAPVLALAAQGSVCAILAALSGCVLDASFRCLPDLPEPVLSSEAESQEIKLRASLGPSNCQV